MVYLIDNHAPSPYHNPQSQVSTWNNPTPYSSLSPGQYLYAQSGDVRQMSGVQFAFMNNEMADMMQEMASDGDNNEEQDTSEDEMSVTTRRSQSLSAGFNRLTIEERVSSSSRPALIHGSSIGKSPRHISIPGDYTEVDDNFYQSDFDSYKVENNIIENSFDSYKEDHVPKRR
jgi:hypothetical protein